MEKSFSWYLKKELSCKWLLILPHHPTTTTPTTITTTTTGLDSVSMAGLFWIYCWRHRPLTQHNSLSSAYLLADSCVNRCAGHEVFQLSLQGTKLYDIWTIEYLILSLFLLVTLHYDRFYCHSHCHNCFLTWSPKYFKYNPYHKYHYYLI